MCRICWVWTIRHQTSKEWSMGSGNICHMWRICGILTTCKNVVYTEKKSNICHIWRICGIWTTGKNLVDTGKRNGLKLQKNGQWVLGIFVICGEFVGFGEPVRMWPILKKIKYFSYV